MSHITITLPSARQPHHSHAATQKKAKKPTDEPTEINTEQPEKEKVPEPVQESVAVVTEKEAAAVKEEREKEPPTFSVQARPALGARLPR